MIKINKQDALNYHMQGQPGKIEVVPTKMLSSQYDLALAYSPGVAEPCKEIALNPEDAYIIVLGVLVLALFAYLEKRRTPAERAEE